MSHKCVYLLLALCFAVENVSGSSSVLTSGLPFLTPSIHSVETSESAAASVQSRSTPSLSKSAFVPSPSTSPSSPSSVSSPAGEVSPTTSVQGTASAAPTGQTRTFSDMGTKGKTIGGLEIAGFVILAILVVLVTAFAIYYVIFRKRMYPDYWSEPLVEAPAPYKPAAAAQPAGVEAGITHEAFVGDTDSPTNVSAPEPEAKIAEPEVKVVEPEVKDPGPEAKVVEQEVKTEGKENKETEDSAL